MFGIGFPELILIFAVALLVLGPKRLPEAARSLGKGYREFQRAMSGFKTEVDKARQSAEDIKDDIVSSATPADDAAETKQNKKDANEDLG